jgi:vacuolar-type H+-ATPase subunit H
MSDEEEAMQSTRTLMMAKRTADAAIADARQEAQKLLADARTTAEQQQRDAQTEADRIVGEARVNADQMTQKATAEASREYGARRDQILAEIGDLENRKVSIASQLTAIEARLEEYRSGLSTIHGAIGGVLDDPETALRSPIPGLDLASLSQPPAETAFAPAETAFAPAETAFAPAETAFAPADTAFATADAFDTGVLDEVPADAAFSAPRSEPTDDAFGDDAFGAAAFEDSAFDKTAFDDTSFDAGSFRSGGGSHFGEATLLDPNDLAVPYADGGTELTGASDLVWSDDEPSDDAPADPWGPGSWNEVSAFTEAPAAFATDDAAFEPESASNAFSDFPSEGLPVIGQDRYNRDLDQAVNQPDEQHDDAMAAFFEGDDDPQSRRFGRRR